MSYYEDSDVKSKKSKQESGRIYSGPCENCRKKIDGGSVDDEGYVQCTNCDHKPKVAKKV